MVNNHALYATAVDSTGERQTFRIGKPADLSTITKRHERVDGRQYQQKRFQTIAANRRLYTVEPFGKARHAWTGLEIRAVDRHGRGLGSERHAVAHPVPYRALRVR